MTTLPAGFYADDSGTSRWWDGERWWDAPPTVPAPSPAPNRRGRRVVMLVAAGVVVVACIGITVVALSRSDGADAGGPKAAVQEMVDGLAAGDCDRVRAVSTTGYWADENYDCELIATYPERMEGMQAEFEIGEPVMIDDVAAEVPAVVTYVDDQGASASLATRFAVTLVADTWLVDGEVDA